MEKAVLRNLLLLGGGGLLLVLGSCAPLVDDTTMLLGNYSYQRGDFQRANLQYLSLLENPQHAPWVLYNLGNVYNALGESSSALEVWDMITGEIYDELEFRLAFNRGHLLYQKGLYQESYNQFKRAIKLRPRSLEAKRNLELTLLKLQALTAAPASGGEKSSPSTQPGSGVTMLEYVKQIEGTRWKSNRKVDESTVSRDW